jgi:hypothetical protein
MPLVLVEDRSHRLLPLPISSAYLRSSFPCHQAMKGGFALY